MKKSNKAFTFYAGIVFLMFGFFASCKDVIKEKVKQVSDDIDREIAQISIEGVDEVVSAASSIRSAISAVETAKSVKGNILTGRATKSRMITGRIVTARSPKISSMASQKKTASYLSPKIGIKTSAGAYSCNEYTEPSLLEIFIGDSAYFLVYQESSYSLGLTFDFTQSSTSTLIEGIFSSCDPSLFPLVCPPTQDDFFFFLESISSYCGDMEISSNSYSDALTLSCYSNTVLGSLSISFYGYNSSFDMSVMYDGSVQVDVCGGGSCYSETLTCDLSALLPDFLVECDIINYTPDYFASEALNFAMNCFSGDGAYMVEDTPSEFCYADQAGGYMTLYTGDSEVYLYTAYMDDGNTYLMKEVCSGNEMSYICDIYISGVPIGTSGCDPSFSCEFLSSMTDIYNFITSLDACSFEIQGTNRGGADGGEYCFSDDLDGDGNSDISVFTSYQTSLSADVWETISVQKLEDGGIITTREVCTYFEQNGGYTQSCTIYSVENGSCEIDTSLCDYTCTGNFKESGFYRDKLGQSGDFSSSACFSLEDIDGDGDTETTWYLANQNILGIYALLGRATLLYSICEFSGASTTYPLAYDLDENVDGNMNCEIFRANCDAVPSCSDDISEFLEGCERKSLRKCSGQVECESIFLSLAVELDEKISQLEEYAETDESGERTIGEPTKPMDLECSITTDPEIGEFISIRKTPEGYEFSKGTTKHFFVYMCPESSQVDFEACSISGCDIPDDRAEDVAEKVAQISEYVETATYISFSLKVSGQVSGIIDVIYSKKERIYDLSGELTLKDGGKLNFSAKVYEDGTAEIEFVVVKPEGDEIQGKFTINQDGSSEGTIKVGDEIYTVKLSSDGKGDVCNGSGKCVEIS